MNYTLQMVYHIKGEEDLEVMFAESKEKRVEITIQGTTRLDERRMR